MSSKVTKPTKEAKEIELTQIMLGIKTPEKFIGERAGQQFMSGTNAVDWLTIATDNYYELQITDYNYKFEYIENWVNYTNKEDVGTLMVLIATTTAKLIIPMLSTLPKDGLGTNFTFIEPGSTMTWWENGNKQTRKRTIIDCNTTVLKSIDTTIKGAETDAIKRALRKFGPGQDLYPGSETRDGNESNKDSLPVLYIKGINVIKDLAAWSNNDVIKIGSELLGKDIEAKDIGTKPEIQRELYFKLRRYYINS